MAFCKSCGAHIDWYQSAETGKWMPLDAGPHPDGNVRVDVLVNKIHVLCLDEVERARAEGKPLYLSHFFSCPQAAQHRRAR